MKLSIVIPTLQEEKIIGRTLKALKELRDFDYEIIISDGHSTDNTVEIAKKYADKVIIHDRKTRQTIGAGRNAGARVASGEYIVCLDGDVFIPNINIFFKKALTIFETNKTLSALTVELKTLPECETSGDRISWWLVNRRQQFLNNFMHIGASCGEFQMFRTDEFRRVGGYSETLPFGEDAEIFARLSKTGKTFFEPSLCVMHTSRRAHNIGWPRLWLEWGVNVISNVTRNKPVVKEWEVSR